MLKFITAAFFAGTILFACNSKEKSNDEPELLRLNNLYDSAITHDDTGTLKRLYADEFVYTSPEGKVLTKEQQINSFVTSEMKWETGKSDDVKVKLFGNTAVMTGSFHGKGTYRGNPVSIDERYTVVWIKKDNEWRMVAEQGNIVK